MTPHTPRSDAMSQYGPPSPALLNALHDALVSERRLLDDLIAQMRRQRTAVGADDIQGVDDSTFATHRILATLGQARQRRRQLNVLLGRSEDCSLKELEEQLGDQIDGRLREARQRLQEAADQLTREVGINRKLLRDAMQATDAQVRTLTGAPTQRPTYAMDSGNGTVPPNPGAPRGLMVNRRA
ncbi:MAG: flagellar protein FlgN [Gemmatimonadaceae bacterium]